MEVPVPCHHQTDGGSIFPESLISNGSVLAANGHVNHNQNYEADSSQPAIAPDTHSRARRQTSSPSGRSASPHSETSDSTRRRVESDTIKEPSLRNSISKNRRRTRERESPARRDKHRERSRTPSPSPKRRRRKHSGSPSKSRSRSSSRRRPRSRSRSRRRSRSRSGSRYDHRRRTRSRSARRSRSRSPRRNGGGGGGGGGRSYGSGGYGRNSERDNPKPSRCVGIFGLNVKTRERDVRELFEKYGPLDNVQLIHDHRSGRSRGFGFVYFADVRDAEDARNAANGMLLDDRRIRVDFSLTQRTHAMGGGGRSRSSPRRDRTRSRSPRRSRSRSRDRSHRRTRSRSPRD
ncbi:putative Transformer-2 protein-like protein beta [Hypsibius exemplaris]|uniref:Transformer-2 protein-like protein beta n=1 Tax=Hypsibius exemplaris TaxID=2072580 RepID=A0A1W0WBT6_HYPEX|nr:putative Transformer-2 protein-like protein beta [Hypsibius exemplaris]